MEKKVLNYRVIINQEKYPDGKLVYVAYCPTLDISDYGDTVEQVMDSIKSGIELAIESLADENKEIPVDNIDTQIITAAQVNIPPKAKLSFA